MACWAPASTTAPGNRRWAVAAYARNLASTWTTSRRPSARRPPPSADVLDPQRRLAVEFTVRR